MFMAAEQVRDERKKMDTDEGVCFCECLLTVWLHRSVSPAAFVTCPSRTRCPHHPTNSHASPAFAQRVSEPKRPKKEEDPGLLGHRVLPGPRQRVLAGQRGKCDGWRGDGRRCPAAGGGEVLQDQQQTEGPCCSLVQSKLGVHLHSQLL